MNAPSVDVEVSRRTRKTLDVDTQGGECDGLGGRLRGGGAGVDGSVVAPDRMLGDARQALYEKRTEKGGINKAVWTAIDI